MADTEPIFRINSEVFDNSAMVQAMRAWHQNEGTARPVGVSGTGKAWRIPYGTKYKPRNGFIQVERENFKVTGATAGGPDQAVKFWPEDKYNHQWPRLLTPKVIEKALNCPNLYADGNEQHRSVVILLFSECARSVYVQKFVKAVLESTAFTELDWLRVQKMTKEYGTAVTWAKRQIAPGPAWQELTAGEHMAAFAGPQGNGTGHADYARLLCKIDGTPY